MARWALWVAMLAATTAALLAVRGQIDQSHVALTLLLVVLGGSAGGGRALGFALAAAGFLIIDYFFQWPYDRLTVAGRLDWIVLAAFLASAFVATELVTTARQQAAEARRLAYEAKHARELLEANRAKDEVLAAVSHDLRTPLTTIKLLAQRSAARGDPAGPAIEEQTDRLSHIVTNVLDLSRIRAGAVALDVQINTLDDLVGAAIARVEGVLNGRQVVPRVNMEEPALVGRFDFVQALRIAGNLVDNALRYSAPDGVVELEAVRDGQFVALRVCDRGPGIAPAELERIFEPFYRPAGEAPDAGHAGLGLSIARRLAELQGGHVDYEPRPDGGSVFVLRLPAAEL